MGQHNVGRLSRQRLFCLKSWKYHEHEQNKSDGVKVNFSKGWLHVRASNTEPIVRIFAEAETKEEAQELIEAVKKLA